jgi:hypothetical protein
VGKAVSEYRPPVYENKYASSKYIHMAWYQGRAEQKAMKTYRKAQASRKEPLILLRNHLRKLAVLNHVGNDVQPADEFAVNDKLREGWPFVDNLETCERVISETVCL